MAGWGAFVGRERELSRLQSALAKRTRLVLVVGDAGIGKTRFVAGVLSRRRRWDAHDQWGCLPLAEKLPLLPVADALGELIRLDGGAPFEAAITAVARLCAPGGGASAAAAGGRQPSPAGPVEGWLHERLFAAVAELLNGVARRSPVGLLIEDVHWADGATLDFLTYFARAGSGRPGDKVAVTCRGDEVPLDAAVADWLTHVRRERRGGGDTARPALAG